MEEEKNCDNCKFLKNLIGDMPCNTCGDSKDFSNWQPIEKDSTKSEKE